jgi:hypothetical protein
MENLSTQLLDLRRYYGDTKVYAMLRYCQNIRAKPENLSSHMLKEVRELLYQLEPKLI